jgi:transposase
MVKRLSAGNENRGGERSTVDICLLNTSHCPHRIDSLFRNDFSKFVPEYRIPDDFTTMLSSLTISFPFLLVHHHYSIIISPWYTPINIFHNGDGYPVLVTFYGMDGSVFSPLACPLWVEYGKDELLDNGYSKGCSLRGNGDLLREALREKGKREEENKKLRETLSIAQEEMIRRESYICELEGALSEAEKQLREVRDENKKLVEQLLESQAKANLFAQMLFGRRSEKLKEEEGKEGKKETQENRAEKEETQENGAEKEETQENGAKKEETQENGAKKEERETEKGDEESGGEKKRKRGAVHGHKGYGRTIPENLEVREKIIDIPEDEKHCDHCGTPFMETGMEELSSQISVEIVYYVEKIKRKVYKKGCDCAEQKTLITAPVAPKIIPKGKFSIEFWVRCLIDKYMNHMPIQRQAFHMSLYGVEVCPSTIFGGFKFLNKEYIKPLYEAMVQELQKASHWHADETRWYVFIEKEGKANHRWMMWCFICSTIRLFVLDPTRASKVAFKTLFDIDIDEVEKGKEGKAFIEQTDIPLKKILNADRYAAYKVLQKAGLILIAYCWAHQRRDFVELETKYPEDKELLLWAKEWLIRIAMLYKINNERVKFPKGEAAFEEYNRELMEKIGEIDTEIHKEYDHPIQSKIMKSMKEHWEGLTLFVEHPEIPMDNNYTERTIRFIVPGRNSYFGNHSQWGGDLSAAMFSIIQTCLMHELSPKAYLEYYFTECAKRGSAPSEDGIAPFLPHNLSNEVKERLKITKKTEALDDS